jgi:hypothetical protein
MLLDLSIPAARYDPVVISFSAMIEEPKGVLHQIDRPGDCATGGLPWSHARKVENRDR